MSLDTNMMSQEIFNQNKNNVSENETKFKKKSDISRNNISQKQTRIKVDWRHESAPGLGQRAGRGGLRGLASPPEGGPQLPGQQVEEILVCPEEELSVLVQRQEGESQPSS